MHNYVPLDEKTITKIKKKHTAWQRYMESREEGKYRKYVTLQNQVKNMIRKAKAVMENDIARDVKKNSKTVLKICELKKENKIRDIEVKIQA